MFGAPFSEAIKWYQPSIQIILLSVIVVFNTSKLNQMKGINYVTDDKNRKVAVQIDLKKYGDLWEDFYENMVAELRKDEEKYH